MKKVILLMIYIFLLDGVLSNTVNAYELTKITVSSTGGDPNDYSYGTSMSANTRFVTLTSYATNLVLNDTNNSADIFLHDRLTKKTSRVSVGADGEQGDGHSYYSKISADGRFITYLSLASNLAPGAGDTNKETDVFLYDRLTRQTTRISVAPDGKQADRYSHSVDISSDGRFVAFASFASNLVRQDTNDKTDIFST